MKGLYSSVQTEYRYLRNKRAGRRIVIGCLAMVVVLVTAFILMLPADTFQKSSVTVYNVNKYPNNSLTTLVYGGSVQNKLGSGMSFTYWDAVIVEKSSSGKLYVAQYITDDVDKRSCAASTSGGFVLLLYNTATDPEIGQEVEVGFDYTKTAAGTNSSGYGKVTFTARSINLPHDNKEALSTVNGADTRDLIEVNLYDYGDNINEKYYADKSYPGFQQDNGTKSIGTSLSALSFNFGNNITSDLDAGHTAVTVKDGTGINATVNQANRPISNALQSTLGKDGYPALADGKSLAYLFSDGKYAVKQNKQSINGLFLYDNATGAYTFNSRANHAQYNPTDDTFTLYDQIITSNFMMYPFGNFLPLNDIVHTATPVNTINKNYFSTVSQRAKDKYSISFGSEYNTLATQLNNFSSRMGNSYTYLECMNSYFKAANLPKTFDPEHSEFDKELIDKLYTIDYDVPTDFYFGMEIKMNFMQPKNGLTGTDGKQPLVFYFTGDDDVWAYVDGVLFLDLSGIHRHVGGEIDFVNGTVKYYELDPNTGDIGTTPYKTVKFSELVDESLLNEKGTFKNYSMHRFNFYYMERGSGSGVCRMNFNFPLVRENSISITKDLDVDEGDALQLLGNPDFRFQALKENGKDLFIGANTDYTIYDISGNKIGTGKTDKNGVFTLKADQTAVFDGIAENSGKYFIRELLDGNTVNQYGAIKVDGSSKTIDYDIVIGEDSFNGISSPLKDISDGSTVFHFNNVVTFQKLGSLSVSKTVTDFSPDSTQTDFAFLVQLDGAPLPIGTEYTVSNEQRTVSEAGIIHLKHGEKAVISNILAGTRFTVQETEASAVGYSVTYLLNDEIQAGSSVSGIIQTETEAKIDVDNAEKGISVELPIEKKLEYPDGEAHQYTFLLEQVTDQSGKQPTEPPLVREISLTVTDEPVSGVFRINYPLKNIETLPQTLYYRITEKENPDDSQTVYDKSVYIAEVTLQRDGAETTATVTALLKDGMTLANDSTILFSNQIARYELPATGGCGIYLYIAGGLLLSATAIYLLYSQYKRRGGNRKYS